MSLFPQNGYYEVKEVCSDQILKWIKQIMKNYWKNIQNKQKIYYLKEITKLEGYN
ncbi:hypothetical protein M067_5063 [Bacteroides fragilis str. J-143-4]|nr:hypothetical protein M067_5063 [Bacteroides fragilis str. J-143-4]